MSNSETKPDKAGGFVLICLVVFGLYTCSGDSEEKKSKAGIAEKRIAVDVSHNELRQMVEGSDDFAQYQSSFMVAARNLIQSGRCTSADFKEMGGWMKSPNNKSEPIYFTYCGGLKTHNKIYLNAVTGEFPVGRS